MVVILTVQLHISISLRVIMKMQVLEDLFQLNVIKYLGVNLKNSVIQAHKNIGETTVFLAYFSFNIGYHDSCFN